MSVSVCLCVCLFVRDHIFELHVDLHQFSMHVTYGRGSVLLWWRSDVVIRCVLPVLWMTSYLLITSQWRLW